MPPESHWSLAPLLTRHTGSPHAGLWLTAAYIRQLAAGDAPFAWGGHEQERESGLSRRQVITARRHVERSGNDGSPLIAISTLGRETIYRVDVEAVRSLAESPAGVSDIIAIEPRAISREGLDLPGAGGNESARAPEESPRDVARMPEIQSAGDVESARSDSAGGCENARQEPLAGAEKNSRKESPLRGDDCTYLKDSGYRLDSRRTPDFAESGEIPLPQDMGPAATPEAATPPDHPVRAELLREGIHPSVIARLARTRDPDWLSARLEHARQYDGVVKCRNFSAYLNSLLTRGEELLPIPSQPTNYWGPRGDQSPHSGKPASAGRYTPSDRSLAEMARDQLPYCTEFVERYAARQAALKSGGS